MKQLVVASLASLAMMACPSQRVDAPPPLPVDWKAINAPPPPVNVQKLTPKERAIAEAYVAGLASPKLEGVGPVFDEEMGHFAFGHRDARARDKIVQMHQELLGAFDQRKSAIGRAWRTDDHSIVEWVVTGVQARDWFGVPATKRPVEIRGIAFLWTQDIGTVSDAHLYFSVPIVKAELGVGPKELQDFVSQGLPAPLTGAFEPDSTDGGGASSREVQNEKVVRDMLDAFENNKEADFLAAYSDDVQVETSSRPKTTKKDDIRAYYRTMHRLVGQLDTTIQSITPIRQYVLLENLISGEQYGPVGLTPAPLDHAAWLEMADVIEMTDDHKIAHIWRCENPDWPQER